MAAMTPQAFSGSDGLTTGMSAKIVVASPASGTTRIIRQLSVYNADSASATVTIQLNDNTSIFRLYTQALAPGATMIYGALQQWCSLDATTKQLEIVLAGAVTTQELEWVAAYGDYTLI